MEKITKICSLVCENCSNTGQQREVGATSKSQQIKCPFISSYQYLPLQTIQLFTRGLLKYKQQIHKQAGFQVLFCQVQTWYLCPAAPLFFQRTFCSRQTILLKSPPILQFGPTNQVFSVLDFLCLR